MKRFLPILFLLASCVCASAQEESSPVEVNGDQVQYSATDSKVVASGNVIVKRAGVTLYCDRLEFDRTQNVGVAEGNVVLVRGDGGR
jgi:lipopolysaccharide assembly outer membrane protein LptD (OstA)